MPWRKGVPPPLPMHPCPRPHPDRIPPPTPVQHRPATKAVSGPGGTRSTTTERLSFSSGRNPRLWPVLAVHGDPPASGTSGTVGGGCPRALGTPNAMQQDRSEGWSSAWRVPLATGRMGERHVSDPANGGGGGGQGCIGRGRPAYAQPGRSLTGKKKVFRYTVFPKKPADTPCVQPWLVSVGGWRLVAVGGGWRRLVVGDWWLVAVGSGWRLAVGRCGGW